MIAGIILAAGRSRRMGEPKALLPLGSTTFLEHIISVLREGGCEDVIVVVGSPDLTASARIAAVTEGAGAQVVENPEAESEQIDSLRLGLESLPEPATAAVVTPVDLPGLSAGVAAAIIRGFEETGSPIVVPRYAGGHGHPVLFSRAVFPELLAGSLSDGARSVVHRHKGDLHEVRVNDPSISQDVNTPAEYRRFMDSRI